MVEDNGSREREPKYGFHFLRSVMLEMKVLQSSGVGDAVMAPEAFARIDVVSNAAQTLTY